MNLKITKERNPLADAFAKSIAKLESQVEIRKLSIVEELLQFMKREGINRSELAERMGVGPSRITAMLSGDSNLTIDTLVRAGRAVGADLAQTFVPQGQKGHWVAAQKVKPTSANCIRVDFTPTPMQHANTPQLRQKQPAKHDAEDAA
jgi:plasmid maintenance system antidote protein VapI